MASVNPAEYSSDTIPGTVFLVGAGPGDAGLITVRGLECLRRADVVLYDYLVNPRLLGAVRSGAESVCLGRHGRDRLLGQEEVNARMIAAARAGRDVVRLKSGDPAVFGRLAEEIAALESAGVRYEVVPGVTAALAVGSYAGVPLTQRDASSAVALVTGHESEDKQAAPLDYRALAGFPGTLVVYMGATTADHWAGQLIAGGRSPDTPVAIVRRCSWPDQSVARATLATVAAAIQSRRMRPPLLVIVGDVVGTMRDATWFTQRPLFGRSILVTRARDQAAPLVDELESLGAEVLIQPAIEIQPPEDGSAIDTTIRRLSDFQGVVFSSRNGVVGLLERIRATGGDARRLAGIKLAAIGPGTAEELLRYGLKADIVPNEFRAEGLVAALRDSVSGERWLLIRASRGREVLAEGLTAAGALVEQLVVYQSLDLEQADEAIRARLAAGRLDWVTVTSSAIARSLARLFGDELKRAKLASISPVTSATLAELGLPVAAEATEYTTHGLARAILTAETAS